MTKIVVGLFDDIRDAQQAVRDLADNGFPRDDISLVARDTGNYGQYLDRTEPDQGVTDTGSDVAEGAGIGAIVGGLAGLIVGLGALAIPGIGPVLAGGWLATTLAGAGIGAAAGGLIGALTEAGVPEEQAQYYAEGVRRGGTLVTVKTPDDMASRAVDILNQHNPVDIQRRADQWRANNWTGFDQNAAPYTAEEVDRDHDLYRTDRDIEGETTLPVVEEELRVGKREVPSGGVRVHTEVEEQPVEETVNLRKEHVEVERHPVDRPLGADDMDAFKEGTIEVTGTSEEPVVEKRARVVEEVEVHKDVDMEQQTVRDTVRRTDVDVENLDAEDVTGMADIDEYDEVYRNHFNTTYSSTGYTYDQFRPAYTYGYDLANEDRFRNRNWQDIETEARRDWERTHPNNAWEDFKDAIREGYYSVKNQL